MRQEAFQHHLTLWIRLKLPCFILSQSIHHQQAKHTPRAKACPRSMLRSGKWRWSEASSVFSSHLPCCLQVAAQDTQPDPQGTAGAQGFVQLPPAPCPSTGVAIPLCPTAHLPRQPVQRGQKSPATTEVSAAETCSHSEPSSLAQKEQDF